MINWKLLIREKPIHKIKAVNVSMTAILVILKCLNKIPLFAYTTPEQSIIKPAIEIIKDKSANKPALSSTEKLAERKY
ncbi:MAG: hypothetical protein WA130_14680 [Candidatus Methanoperedens sp.]